MRLVVSGKVAMTDAISALISVNLSSLRSRRLAQIRMRDPEAEGRFWYSVETTGVFCRPTCPSRFARPEHIRIHETLAEARRTGFRPCLRCRPESPSLQERRHALVEDACRTIERARRRPTLKALARQAGLSPSHFHRIFKAATGTTPGLWRPSPPTICAYHQTPHTHRLT